MLEYGIFNKIFPAYILSSGCTHRWNFKAATSVPFPNVELTIQHDILQN